MPPYMEKLELSFIFIQIFVKVDLFLYHPSLNYQSKTQEAPQPNSIRIRTHDHPN